MKAYNCQPLRQTHHLASICVRIYELNIDRKRIYVCVILADINIGLRD